jgi:NADPH-ferrihemoprotein reductase
LLPSLGASRSSCELFHGDDDPTVHAGEGHDGSDHVLYTQSRPYESHLVAARYLTKTAIDGAMRIVEATGSEVNTSLESCAKARERLEETFPLDGVDSAAVERNGKRVIEVRIGLPDDNSLEYQPGDTIGLMVPNNLEAVSFVLEALKEHHGLLPTQKISINEERPITVQKALEEWVDLCTTLKSKKIINGLSQFASNEQEAATLRLLASKDSNGIRLFQEYIVDQRRSFVDILKDFPSCRCITIEGILSLFPAITPRYYSISSSPLESRDEASLSIAFSVVDYLTPSLVVNGVELGRRRIHGLATLFLETLCSPLLAQASGKPATTSKVKIFPKSTAHFILPSSLTTPMILIGPGTGIAPFMGFLAHRKAQLASRATKEASITVVEGTWRGGGEMDANSSILVGDKDSIGLDPTADYRSPEDVGDVAVFFGCRHEDHDWLFQDEMKTLVDEGPITSLHTAFSRGSHKQYVQDLMKEPSTSKRLIDLLLGKSGVVYICGDGNAMARDVQKALAEILGQQADGSMNLEQGRGEMDRLKKEGRFLLDIWS